MVEQQYFCGEIHNTNQIFDIMNLKEKILAALTAISGQYNLPKEQLEKIAALAPADLTEDKISAWAESQKGLMAMMQSYADSRVTANSKELADLKKEVEDWKKKAEEAGKQQPTTVPADLKEALGAMKKELEDGFNAKLAELTKQNKDLQDQANANAKSEKERQFLEIKKRVAKELGLTDKALELVEGKLTSDMDETKINEVLSAQKKMLVEMGLHSVEDGSVSGDPTEAAKARAKAYLDELEKKQQQNVNQ